MWIVFVWLVSVALTVGPVARALRAVRVAVRTPGHLFLLVVIGWGHQWAIDGLTPDASPLNVGARVVDPDVSAVAHWAAVRSISST
jgi:hypothetical protein